MKKIYIGRGVDCHIRIKDDTDKVSRRQAVIEVSPTGKMRIHDTSTNGTFVNGKKVEKPLGTEVKRGDKVDFAHVAELDWSLVKDPYKMMKIAVGIFVIVLLGLAAYFFIFADTLTHKEDQEHKDLVEEAIGIDSADEDTLSDNDTITVAAPKGTKHKAKKGSGKAGDKKKEDVSDPNKDGTNRVIDGTLRPEKEDGPDANGIRPDMKPDNNSNSLQREKYRK